MIEFEVEVSSLVEVEVLFEFDASSLSDAFESLSDSEFDPDFEIFFESDAFESLFELDELFETESFLDSELDVESSLFESEISLDSESLSFVLSDALFDLSGSFGLFN
ncbi:hypothetical protein JC2156_16430 [Weissella koreensis KCTC 3621]|nr:hypothetical protein JC2156_16430 [Weissella koreensis KCTC 3621]